MSIISIPNTFSPNTVLSASEINSNFSAIYNEFNGGISAANIADGAVTTAKITSSAVITKKIADNAVTDSKRPRLLAAQAYDGTVQSVPTSTWTQVEIDGSTPEFDAEDWVDSNRVTVSEAGVYMLTGSALFSTIGSAKRGFLQITVNGQDATLWNSSGDAGNYRKTMAFGNGSGNTMTRQVAAIEVLSADDYIELWMYHDHGSNRNIDEAYLSAVKLSD